MTAASHFWEQLKIARNMKNQESITSPKDRNNLPVTNPEDMEICNLPNAEFKIAVFGRLGELQEDTEGQFNKIKKTIHKQNQNFSFF